MGFWEKEACAEKRMKLEADGEGDSKNGVEP